MRIANHRESVTQIVQDYNIFDRTGKMLLKGGGYNCLRVKQAKGNMHGYIVVTSASVAPYRTPIRCLLTAKESNPLPQLVWIADEGLLLFQHLQADFKLGAGVETTMCPTVKLAGVMKAPPAETADRNAFCRNLREVIPSFRNAGVSYKEFSNIAATFQRIPDIERFLQRLGYSFRAGQPTPTPLPSPPIRRAEPSQASSSTAPSSSTETRKAPIRRIWIPLQLLSKLPRPSHLPPPRHHPSTENEDNSYKETPDQNPPVTISWAMWKEYYHRRFFRKGSSSHIANLDQRIPQLQASLQECGVGKTVLEKMGWKEGEGLKPVSLKYPLNSHSAWPTGTGWFRGRQGLATDEDYEDFAPAVAEKAEVPLDCKTLAVMIRHAVRKTYYGGEENSALEAKEIYPLISDAVSAEFIKHNNNKNLDLTAEVSEEEDDEED
ncbi:hypothetical protein SpCBS45565_g08162 [Spizellomyces sp. 'palustris']|nr:hypothetical protein SpCBS45565_g08162 [Spizellomyces sp. 'palustris']